MRQTRGSEMRFLDGQDVRRALRKHSESRLQPGESAVIPLTSVQFISSQSKKTPNVYDTLLQL